MTELSIKGKTHQGTVISAKMHKTIVVSVARREKHPLGKYINRTTKYYVHDAQGIAKEGDLVLIQESRPISKTKAWILVNVLEKTG